MKTAKIIPTSTLMVAALGLALGLAAAPALANPADSEGCHDHKECVADPSPSGGGKALLFAVKGLAVDECGGNTTDPLGASFGQVDWKENILWDPNFIHVHLKLQLKDVDPGTYEVFGNFDPACGTGRVDRPLCEGGVCDVSVTVKQSGKGRTSGVLRICPFQDAGTLVTVWLTVTVNGSTKILRSTPVTMVLPPNQVGSECT